MKFYTFVDIRGSRIFHRYVEDGKHYQEVIDKFPIELFMENDNTIDSYGLMGEKLSKIEFSEIREAKEFINNYKS